MKKTFMLLKDIGDSIYSCIKFKVKIPSFHMDGRLPILDLKLEANNDQLEHGFYKKQKTYASVGVVLYTSA